MVGKSVGDVEFLNMVGDGDGGVSVGEKVEVEFFVELLHDTTVNKREYIKIRMI